MQNFIDQLFEQGGLPAGRTSSGHQCPSDEAFTGYLNALTPARDREALECHALVCADCHELLRAVVDSAAATFQPVPVLAPQLASVHLESTGAPASVHVVGRLLRRGLQLVNHLELSFRTLTDGPMTPALGVLRRGESAGEPATTEWVCVRGPGSGLDELELQVQTNGTARLTVRCDRMPELGADELASIVLDVDGAAREKRPFSGEPMSFAPLGVGRYRVRLVARAPGGPARPLAEAQIDFVN